VDAFLPRRSARPSFVKRGPAAPPGFFACEVAGLRWLAAADGGAACARVIGHDETSLTLERLSSVAPDRAAAYGFGGRLARTHDAGAAGFGAPPDGWTGPGFFGPLHRPLPMSLTGHPTWGGFYAAQRLAPMFELAGPLLGAVSGDVQKVISRCSRGDFDDDDEPARLHGDLWSGNVMWTSDGVVLIDPAAHGGHRETDLAMLALFGCPFLNAVIDGYQHQRPLRAGWRQRIGLHQLYPLLAHVVLFGGGYAALAGAAARSALSPE
jgi:fructosamine-3-kinase